MVTQIQLNEEEVSKAVIGLCEISQKKFDIVDVPDKISLSITFKKVPSFGRKVKAKAKTVSIDLPNSVSHDKQLVCMFVKDLDKENRDYEETKQHFQALFKQAGLKAIPDIIPIKNLLLEYKPYEAKINLSNMYDVFLADSRVSKVLPTILGKHFYGRKKIPKRVIMTADSLKDEVLGAIDRVEYVMSMRGSNSMVQVAHSKMEPKDIVANIMAAVKQIGEVVPGGADNIRNLYIKTYTSVAIPLYVSLDSANSVELPDLQIQEEEEEDEPEELTSLEDDLKIKVTKLGDVLIYNKNGKRLSKDKTKKLFEDFEELPKSKARKRKLAEAANEENKRPETRKRSRSKPNVKPTTKYIKKPNLDNLAPAKKTKNAEKKTKIAEKKTKIAEKKTVNKPKRTVNKPKVFKGKNKK